MGPEEEPPTFRPTSTPTLPTYRPTNTPTLPTFQPTKTPTFFKYPKMPDYYTAKEASVGSSCEDNKGLDWCMENIFYCHGVSAPNRPTTMKEDCAKTCGHCDLADEVSVSSSATDIKAQRVEKAIVESVEKKVSEVLEKKVSPEAEVGVVNEIAKRTESHPILY